MADFQYPQIASLQKQTDQAESNLDNSPTAFASNTTPTNRDLSNDVKYRALQDKLATAQSNQTKENWYGKTDPAQEAEGGANDGILTKALNALSTPLYAVSGAAEWALGKGTKSNLLENIDSNIKEREGFGSILSKYGAPTIVSAPLGFALDVAFDPVNWVTMGTGALIPRVGVGLAKGFAEGGVKGALEAGAAGLESGVLKNLNTASKFVPFGDKIGLTSKIADRSIAAIDKYKALTGVDVENDLGKSWFGLSDLNAGKTIGNATKNAIRMLPKGDDILKAFEYSPQTYHKMSILKDKIESQMGDISDQNINRISNSGNLPSMSEVLEGNYAPKATNPIEQSLQEAHEVMTAPPTVTRATNQEELLQRMQEEAVGDKEFKAQLDNFIKTKSGETGLKFYDDAAEAFKQFKIKDVAVGQKVIDFYNDYIKFFKMAKVPASIGAHANAWIGNNVMAMMALGSDALRPELRNSIFKLASKITSDKADASMLRQAFFSDVSNWADFMGKSSGTFGRTFGFKPDELAAKFFTQKAIESGKGLGLWTANNQDQLLKSTEDAVRELQDMIERTDDAAQARTAAGTKMGDAMNQAEKLSRQPKSTPLEFARGIMHEGGSASDMPTSWAANELAGNRWMDFIQQRAEAGSPGFKILGKVLESSTKAYERPDQWNKLGTAMFLTKDGLSENGLRLLSRVVPLEKADILSKYSKGGEYFYRLSPERATAAVNEMYMNYAAMPSAIKVLRSIPIMGSPFVSFQYAMLSKMGKTAIHNPAIFNKINMFLNEAQGPKSPLERKALQSQYGQMFNNQGMEKLPFFKDNPMYLNVSSMIPYYSLNMFTPAQRKYENTLPANLVSFMDKTPLFKDPIGQMLFDYVLQPMLIKEQSQGQFGQPLYPKNATTLDKVGYAAQSLAESVTPGIASLAGLVTPASVAKYAPSYRWRQIAEAKAGNNQLGIQGKEDPFRRTMRALAASAGVSISPLDLTYLSNTVKKSVKK